MIARLLTVEDLRARPEIRDVVLVAEQSLANPIIQLGVVNAIGIPAWGLSAENCEVLRGRRLYFAYSGGEAARAPALAAALHLRNQLNGEVSILLSAVQEALDSGADLGAFAEHLGAGEVLAGATRDSAIVTPAQVLARERPVLRPLSTPWGTFNRRLFAGGLSRDRVIGIIGGPGTGKSRLAGAIAEHAAQLPGFVVLHVDYELGEDVIVDRAVAARSRTSFWTVRTREGRHSEPVRNANAEVSALSRWHIVSVPKADGTIDEARLLAWLDQTSANVLVVDSLHKFAARAYPSLEPRMAITNAAYALEHICLSRNIHVVMTVESKRAPGGGYPKPEVALTSGAESRVIEFVTGQVLYLYPDRTGRDAVEVEEHSEDRVQLHIAKQTSGTTGRVPADLVYEHPHFGVREEPLAVRRSSELREAILALLSDKPLASKELAKLVHRRRKTVDAELIHMATEDLARQLSDGGKPLGWIRIQSVPQSGPGPNGTGSQSADRVGPTPEEAQ